MKFTYYGHAAFSLSEGDYTLLIDPFFTGNTWNVSAPSKIQCSYIFISHGHGDHYGDVEEIAKANDALVIATAEVAAKAAEAGCRTHAMHIGGKADFPFGDLRLTPAFHGAGVPGGHAAGCLIHMGGKRIYYAGDTSLYSDMKLHSRFGPIDCAILPIGDNFTMGMEDAALAASWIQPKVVIPVHYRTWPIIDQDPQQFKEMTEKNYAVAVQVVDPGTTWEI